MMVGLQFQVALVVMPGLASFATVTLYNLLGDGLRDALDPKLRGADG